MSQIDYPGSTQTVCLAINDLGEITGYYLDTNNGPMVSSPRMARFGLFPFLDAVGIDNGGSFVGSNMGKNQEDYGYVATPVFAPQVE